MQEAQISGALQNNQNQFPTIGGPYGRDRAYSSQSGFLVPTISKQTENEKNKKLFISQINTLLQNKHLSKTPEAENPHKKSSPSKSISLFQPSMEEERALAQNLLSNSKNFKDLFEKI